MSKKPSAETQLKNLKAEYKRAKARWAQEVEVFERRIKSVQVENAYLREMVEFAKLFAPVRDEELTKR